MQVYSRLLVSCCIPLVYRANMYLCLTVDWIKVLYTNAQPGDKHRVCISTNYKQVLVTYNALVAYF